MIRFDRLSVTYGGKSVFANFSFQPALHAITCLMGRSGVGKTSLLRIAAGLQQPDDGCVIRPEGRVGYVFQEPRLLPWFTVEENLMWLLPNRSVQRKARVRALLDAVGMGAETALYPAQLSGGMKQRVSLARAFLMSPRFLLMDEPFQGLDKQTRMNMYGLLLSLWEAEKPTVLLVTHDLEEARTLGHHIIKLTGSPVTGYTELANKRMNMEDEWNEPSIRTEQLA